MTFDEGRGPQNCGLMLVGKWQDGTVREKRSGMSEEGEGQSWSGREKTKDGRGRASGVAERCDETRRWDAAPPRPRRKSEKGRGDEAGGE